MIVPELREATSGRKLQPRKGPPRALPRVALMISALAVFLVCLSSPGCAREARTTLDVKAGAADTTSPDTLDAALLAQGPLPPVARVDYSRFPAAADVCLPGARTLWVAPWGRDDGPGSEGSPFRTIESALEEAADGDRVVVRAGTYLSEGLQVTQSHIEVAAWPGETVVVQALPGARRGLTIAHPGQHHVRIRGLEISGFEGVGIHLGHPETVRSVILENLVVRGSLEGLAGSYVDGVAVDGLLVHGMDLLDIGGIGFQFGVGEGRNVRIVGLHVRMRGLGGDNSGADGVAFERGDNVLIENSIVEGAGADGIDLKASRVAIVNSVVRHVGRNGIKLWDGGDILNCIVFDTGADAQVVTEEGSYRIVNSVFAYHLMHGGYAYAATFGYDRSGPLEVDLVNCVFFRQPSKLYFAPQAQVRLTNNLFSGFPGPLIQHGSSEWGPSDLGAAGAEGGGVPAGGGGAMPGGAAPAGPAPAGPAPDPIRLGTLLAVGNLFVDPEFVDAPGGDFRPAPGSPLPGAGLRTSLVTSFDMFLRPRTGDGCAIGPYENGEAPDPTAVVFTDVPAGHRHAVAINGLWELGVVAGYVGAAGSREFRPAEPLNRAQYAKMLCVALGVAIPGEGDAPESGAGGESTAAPPFSDLGPDDPADPYPHQYVAAAQAAGIVQGMGGGRFAPWEPVSCAQAITMGVRALERLRPGVLTPAPAEFAGPWSIDFDDVHGPAAALAAWNGLLEGLDPQSELRDPWGPASRGVAAELVWAFAGT